MNESMRDAEHAAVDELLPWYVNRTLDPAELARVVRHLEVCEDCRENVSLLSRARVAINRPAATPILPPPRPEALLAAIERSTRSRSQGLQRPVAAAAAAVGIAATALLMWPQDEAGVPEPLSYETVTSVPQPAPMDYVMSLMFEPGVAAEDRRRVLADLDAGDVRLDESSGIYQVNVRLEASSLDDLTRFTAAVSARPEIRSAQIVALQLPMQRETGQDDR